MPFRTKRDPVDLEKLHVYRKSPPASLVEFVAFWSERYAYPNEEWYEDNIRGPHTTDGLTHLFKWKMEPRFRVVKMPQVKQSFLSRFEEAKKLSKAISKSEPIEAAKLFLSTFNKGGGIWRIFWLHCWDNRCPIFDQHVHRAMAFIEDGKGKELPAYEPKVVEVYLKRFMPFVGHFKGIDGRKIDKALFQFGKSIKDGSLPSVKK